MASDTKQLILDTAEELFAEHGIDAVSLRAITGEAGVNLASVNYHFGSKEALVKAVFARRIEGVNRERLRLLAECEARAGSEAPQLEEVIRAFMDPPLRSMRQEVRGEVFLRVCGRIYAETAPQIRAIFLELFGEVFERFGAALHRALPHMPQEEIIWRFHFAIGAMAHTMLESETLKQFCPGLAGLTDIEATIERLTQFAAAGMRAPVPALSPVGMSEPAAIEEVV